MVTASSVFARLDVMGEAMLLAIFAICCSVLIGFAAHHANPTPFVWTRSARDILQKVIRANSRLSFKQNVTLHQHERQRMMDATMKAWKKRMKVASESMRSTRSG